MQRPMQLHDPAKERIDFVEGQTPSETVVTESDPTKEDPTDVPQEETPFEPPENLPRVVTPVQRESDPTKARPDDLVEEETSSQKATKDPAVRSEFSDPNLVPPDAFPDRGSE